MSRRVLVTHPGRQHSHRAALALEKVGRLAGYWAGVPPLQGAFSWISDALWTRFVRYAPVSLPESRCRSAAWIPALRRMGDRLPRSLSKRIDLAGCRVFDRWVASRLSDATGAEAVLACEISALDTFAVARHLGWVTLLDAPSIHHAAQDRLHGTDDPPAVHGQIVEIKNREIALADAIVTVSELARSTYVDAGVPESKVISVPLGADLQLFRAPAEIVREGAVRFLFAGAPIRRKGFDLLVTALERLSADGVEFHLRLAGPRGEQSHLVERLARERWSAAGQVAQAELAAEMARADLLVLPSRNDSYGMVVAEALATGLPALVSTMVGAAELVENGRSGFVVPVDDLEALYQCLRSAALAPAHLRSMAGACRTAAQGASWEAYGERLNAALAPLLERADL